MPWPPAGRTDVGPGLPVNSSVTGGSGPASSFAAQVSGPSALPQHMVLFLPEERPIPGATLFTVQGQFTTVAAQSNVAIPNCTIQIPPGNLARLESITFVVDNLLLSSQITFTVRQNNAPITGFSNVGVIPGVVAQKIDNYSVFYRVPLGALLSVVFTNTDGGSYLVGAALSGWYWPETTGQLYMRQGQPI